MSDLIRSGSVYVSRETRKALRIISTAKGRPLDEIVDIALTKWLYNNYPSVMDFLSGAEEMEEVFGQRLKEQMEYSEVVRQEFGPGHEPEVKGQTKR